MDNEPIKIVFWDLDGTLWQGTLEEDAAALLVPSQVAQHLFVTLDERGILNSIISQAAASVAWAHLKQHGLDSYFVNAKFDVVSKAQAIATTLQELNLLARNAAFIDDLPFYRAEIKSMLPEVMTLAPEQMEGLLTHARFSAPSTLGATRRHMYQAEAARNTALASFAGSRADFLRSCQMQLHCAVAEPGDLPRVEELFGRTHRLSAQPAGNMSTEVQDAFRQTRTTSTPKRSNYVAKLQDRFGDYGLIAAATLDWGSVVVQGNTYISCERLAVSCRVQGRGVLEAFLYWLNSLAQQAAVPILIPIDTQSDVNKALRQSLRFSGYAAVERGSSYELLTLLQPQRLQVPEWITLQPTTHE